MAKLERGLEGLVQSEQVEQDWRGHSGLGEWDARKHGGDNAHICLCSLPDGRVWANSKKSDEREQCQSGETGPMCSKIMHSPPSSTTNLQYICFVYLLIVIF